MADNAIVAVSGRELLTQLGEALHDYAEAGQASSTKRAYGSAWRGFSTWCASVDLEPLPSEAATVALYLTVRARQSMAVATLALHIAAIRAAHLSAGYQPPAHPDLDSVWAGIKRTHGRPPRKKRALLVEDLRRVVARLPDTLTGIRDRAILLVGFAGALRRDELAKLSLPGAQAGPIRVEFVGQGLEIHLDRSKGDQLGRGAVVAVPFGKRVCPVAALQAWISAAKITAGPVFRKVDRHGRLGGQALSDKAIANIVKAAVERVGLDPAAFAGHSLRRGLITSANAGGADLAALKAHARHAKAETTIGYIEEGERFTKSAAGKAGL